MNQILSQNEVEALLKAVGEGNSEEDPGRATGENATPLATTGSARPSIGMDRRFEVIRPLLDEVLDQCIKSFRSYLLGVLEKDLTVERFASELVMLQDFTRRYDMYKRPYIFLPFDIAPPNRPGLVVCEPGLAIGLMEGMMGGALENDPAPAWRSLTSLELRVAERILKEFLESMQRAFSSRLGISLSPLRLVASANLARGMRDMTQVLTIGVRVLIRGKHLGEFFLIFPQEMIGTFRQDGGAGDLLSPEELSRWDNALIDGLSRVSVMLSGELGALKMSVSELLNLKVGDTIVFENARPGVATVVIEGVPKMTAIPGVYRGRKALRLT